MMKSTGSNCFISIIVYSLCLPYVLWAFFDVPQKGRKQNDLLSMLVCSEDAWKAWSLASDMTSFSPANTCACSVYRHRDAANLESAQGS